MKDCRECGELKPFSEYYKHKAMADGHLNKCKDCVKTRVSNHRDHNLERIQEYDRNRPNAKDRVKDCCDRAKEKRLEGTEDYLEKERERVRKYRRENKLKYKAHCSVNNAVRDVVIVKPHSCEHCNEVKDLHGHHWSYLEEHWLDVIWLCCACHGAEHKRLNEVERSKV